MSAFFVCIALQDKIKSARNTKNEPSPFDEGFFVYQISNESMFTHLCGPIRLANSR